MDVGPDIAQQGMQFPMDVPPTLVKFDPPIFAGLEPSSEANTNRSSNHSGNEPGGGGRGGGGKENNGHQGKTSQLDDMVNSMLPPREWTEETGTWMQYVSKEPATRLAVITLQVSLHAFVLREFARVLLYRNICCRSKAHERVRLKTKFGAGTDPLRVTPARICRIRDTTVGSREVCSPPARSVCRGLFCCAHSTRLPSHIC